MAGTSDVSGAHPHPREMTATTEVATFPAAAALRIGIDGESQYAECNAGGERSRR